MEIIQKILTFSFVITAICMAMTSKYDGKRDEIILRSPLPSNYSRAYPVLGWLMWCCGLPSLFLIAIIAGAGKFISREFVMMGECVIQLLIHMYEKNFPPVEKEA